MFGFLYTIGPNTFQFFNIGGFGTTTINGINDAGDIVGFFANAKGNTIGLLGTPAAPSVAETGATAQSFNAYSLLARDAGAHSSLHHEPARVNEALNVAVGPHQW